MANRNSIIDLSDKEKTDPLYEENQTDHIDFLPQGSFRLFSLMVNGSAERILIASKYIASRDIEVDHSGAYLLNYKKPCVLELVDFAGYFSRGSGEEQQIDVIRIDDVPYILSLTQFSPGGTAASIHLTQVPNVGAKSEQSNDAFFFTKSHDQRR
jgi:hypothetical protein